MTKSDILSFFQPLLDENGYLTHTFTTDKGIIHKSYTISIILRVYPDFTLYTSCTYSVRISDSTLIINSWDGTEVEVTYVISIPDIIALSKINHP